MLDSHLLQLQHIWVVEELQELYFSQCGDGEAVFLVVHEDLLEGDDSAGLDGFCSVYFTESTFAQLPDDLVFSDARAAFEAGLWARVLAREGSRGDIVAVGAACRTALMGGSRHFDG